MTTTRIRQPTKADIQTAIEQLQQSRNSQTQLNRWARMSAEQSEQWAGVAEGHADRATTEADKAESSAQRAEKWARSIDPLSIVSVCLAVSVLATICVCATALSRLPQMPASSDANITITP